MKNGRREHGAASLVIGDCVALPQHMLPVTREVCSVHTPGASQGRGDATALMHQVCDEADRESITLVLWPNPFGDDIALSRAQLIEWYARRFGFVRLPGDVAMLARSPGATPRYLTPIAYAAAVSCG